jgi:hypothetical protein
MATSEAHRKAQFRIHHILYTYYNITSLEAFTPTPNEKYIMGDDDEFVTKPYLLDIFASNPRDQCIVKHPIIGIEIDGAKGHKKTARQTQRDKDRTNSLQDTYPNLKIFRFDTKDLVGKGYLHPKTKVRKPLLTDDDIKKELGLGFNEHDE